MNDTTEQATLNLDDVEGHGLKEVAAGISTAAIMVAGGAGVAAAAGGGGSTGASVHLGDKTISAQVATPDTTITLPDVAVPHVNAPHITVPTVNAPDVKVPTVNVPDVQVGATVNRAVDRAVTTVHATEHTLHSNVVTAKAKVAGVEHDAHTVVQGTKAAATTAVQATTAAVTTTVNRAEGLVQTTLQAEVKNVGTVYTAVIRVVNGDKGTSVKTDQANGTVTLTSGGAVIATGNVVNGLATLTWSGNHGTMTLSFGGDSNHSGATIHL